MCPYTNVAVGTMLACIIATQNNEVYMRTINCMNYHVTIIKPQPFHDPNTICGDYYFLMDGYRSLYRESKRYNFNFKQCLKTIIDTGYFNNGTIEIVMI